MLNYSKDLFYLYVFEEGCPEDPNDFYGGEPELGSMKKAEDLGDFCGYPVPNGEGEPQKYAAYITFGVGENDLEIEVFEDSSCWYSLYKSSKDGVCQILPKPVSCLPFIYLLAANLKNEVALDGVQASGGPKRKAVKDSLCVD